MTAFGIVIPQQVTKDANLISVSYGGKTIIWKAASAVSLNSGNAYSAELDITGNTISGTVGIAQTPAL